MVKNAISGPLESVRKLLEVQALRGASDQELLSRFIASADAAAFRVIAERHGPMVLGVCRRGLGCPHDAEDAFQATFLVLARSARSLRKSQALGSWLHGIARRVCRNLVRDRQRRERRETAAAPRCGSNPLDEVTWAEAKTALDEELERLSPNYRDVLVACYLEGKTRDEAAHQLGLTPGALHGRLERARKLLADRLTARGLSLSAALLAVAGSPSNVSGMLRAVSGFVASGPVAGGVQPAALPLTKDVLKGSIMAKAKRISVGFLATVAVAAGVTFYLARPERTADADGLPGVTASASSLPQEELPFALELRGKSAYFFDKPGAAFAAVQPAGGVLTRLVPSGEVSTWTLSDGKQGPARRLPGRKAIGLSPDGLAAVMADGKRVSVVDPATGQVLASFETVAGPAEQTPGNVRPLAGAPAANIPPAAYDPTLAVLSPDRQTVAIRCAGTIEVWSVAEAPRRLASFKLLYPVALDFSPDGKLLACVGINPSEGLSVWELATRRRALHVESPRVNGGSDGPSRLSAAHSVAFTPDGKTVVVGGREHRRWPGAVEREEYRGWVRAVALADGKERWAATFPPAKADDAVIAALGVSRDGRFLAAAATDGALRLYHVPTGRELGETQAGAGWNGLLHFTADGKQLFVAGPSIKCFELHKRPLPGGSGQASQSVRPAAPAKTSPSSGAAEYQALEAEYRQLGLEAAKAADEARTDDERARVFETFRHRPAEFARRFLELAGKHPNDPAAGDALLWVVRHIGKGPEAEKAAETLLRDYWGNEKLLVLFQRETGNSFSSVGMTILRAFAEKGADRRTQAQARYKLARSLHTGARTVERLHRDTSGEFARQLETDTPLGELRVAYLKGQDPKRLREEAVQLLDEVVAKYADVPDPFARRTLGEAARATRNEWRSPTIAVGKAAPEIEGADADGKRFKLSDYRGKVILLTFSGNWCGPCKAMYPHERRLVERCAGQPFAALSVNTDQTLETLKEAVRKGDITWRCWWDGREGPIASAWGIEAYPTIFVLDGKGVIRHEGVRGGELERAVELLLKETEAAAGKPALPGKP